MNKNERPCSSQLNDKCNIIKMHWLLFEIFWLDHFKSYLGQNTIRGCFLNDSHTPMDTNPSQSHPKLSHGWTHLTRGAEQYYLTNYAWKLNRLILISYQFSMSGKRETKELK